jgi:hypothetical protein
LLTQNVLAPTQSFPIDPSLQLRIPRSLALALILVSAPINAGLPIPEDAGGGQDAPDDANRALQLPPGSYEDNLTPGTDRVADRDWYEIDRTAERLESASALHRLLGPSSTIQGISIDGEVVPKC